MARLTGERLLAETTRTTMRSTVCLVSATRQRSGTLTLRPYRRRYAGAYRTDTHGSSRYAESGVDTAPPQ